MKSGSFIISGLMLSRCLTIGTEPAIEAIKIGLVEKTSVSTSYSVAISFLTLSASQN